MLPVYTRLLYLRTSLRVVGTTAVQIAGRPCATTGARVKGRQIASAWPGPAVRGPACGIARYAINSAAPPACNDRGVVDRVAGAGERWEVQVVLIQWGATGTCALSTAGPSSSGCRRSARTRGAARAPRHGGGPRRTTQGSWATSKATGGWQPRLIGEWHCLGS